MINDAFFSLLVMGDISETPPDSAKLQKVSSPDVDLVDKADDKEKKKDRGSRFFGSTSSDTKEHKEHPKLSKRLSQIQRPNGKEKAKEKEKDRDKEDGCFKDVPMAGIVHSLMFTYSYTRKGGKFIFCFRILYLCFFWFEKLFHGISK